MNTILTTNTIAVTTVTAKPLLLLTILAITTMAAYLDDAVKENNLRATKVYLKYGADPLHKDYDMMNRLLADATRSRGKK